jgi:hypothetical protein
MPISISGAHFAERGSQNADIARRSLAFFFAFPYSEPRNFLAQELAIHLSAYAIV